MSLKIIKNKIRGIDKTHKVTKAMEAVSAVKMRKSQERAFLSRPYARAALTILKRVSGSVDVVNHPLTQKREGDRACVLLVTSDKGLAGSLNTAVLKEVRRIIQSENISQKNILSVCIGKKGFEFCEKQNFSILKHFDNISDDVSIDDMKEVTTELVNRFTSGDIDRCVVVYSNFISTFEQEAISRQLLPISFEEVERVIKDIIPEKGKYAEGADKGSADEEKGVSGPVVYTIEPSPEEVLEELLPSLLNIQLYHVLLEAKACEHSARMVAMKNASDKAQEMSKELTLKFNKARQSLITREISEIIGGVEAMK